MGRILSVMLACFLVLPSQVFAHDDVAANPRDVPLDQRVTLSLTSGQDLTGRVDVRPVPSAQSSDPATVRRPATTPAALLKDVPPGSSVKLELQGGKKVTGTVKEARPDAVVLERAGIGGSDNLTLPADQPGGVRVDYSTVTKATVSGPRTVATFGDLQRVLTVGQKVTVTDVDGTRTTGTLAEVSSTSLRLSADSKHVFTEDQVSMVARRGDPLWNGTAIGAGIGIAAGIMTARAGEATSDEAFSVVLMSGGIYAAIGLAIDAAIGRDVPLFVRRPSSALARVAISPIVSGDEKGVRLGVRW